jgi:F5/8 type C domain-containing protein
MTRSEAAAVVAAFVVLAVVWTWPLALRPGTTMAAPFGDPLLNAWILGWDADRLRHGFAGLWTAPSFHPNPDTLAYSEHLLGIAIPLAPIYWATGNAVLLYNAALVGSFALAGAGMYLLARDLTGRRDAAILAGLAFMWCPYRAPHVTHLQVLVNGWMPIALWALHRYFATGSRRALAGFVVAFAAQGLSNGYFLFFLAVPVAIVAVVELARHRDRLPLHLVRLAIAAVVIGAIIAPAAAAYLRVKREQGLSRARSDAVNFGAAPADYARVSHQPILWSKVLPAGGAETELFPGLTVIVLAIGVLVPAVRRTGSPPGLLPESTAVPLYGSIALVAFVLSMGPEPLLWDGMRLPTGPYAWLGAIVPGLDGLRVPARFASVVYVALAVLAAFGAGRLLDRVAAGARAAVVAGLGAVIVAEGYIGPLPLERLPSAEMAMDRAAYEFLASRPDGAVLELPMGGPDPAVRYQFRTLLHGHRIVNGYSGYGSALQDFLTGPPSTEPDGFAETVALGRAIGVRYLVVHGQLYRDRETARRVADDIRAQTAHVARASTFGPVTVFELRAPESMALPVPAGVEIPQASFRLSASHNPGAVGAMVDGNPVTRWLSGVPQDGTEWIRVDFDRPRRPAFLRLAMDRRSFGDYPRRLEIEGTADGTTFVALAAGPTLRPFGQSLVELPVSPRIDLALPGLEVKAVRLRQTGRTPRQWYWSVHEIRLWE